MKYATDQFQLVLKSICHKILKSSSAVTSVTC